MFIDESVWPIGGPIIFPPIDFNQVILSHKIVLVLTLGVDDFDVRRILINPRSSVDFLQMSACRYMGTPHLL